MAAKCSSCLKKTPMDECRLVETAVGSGDPDGDRMPVLLTLCHACELRLVSALKERVACAPEAAPEAHHLVPSQVTQPGFYWAERGDEHLPTIVGVLAHEPGTGEGMSALAVLLPGEARGQPLNNFAWFVGPIAVPAE